MAKRLLVIDDNPKMIDVYLAVLGEAGYEVAAAGDGLQALQYLEAQIEPPDLVLMDIDMPRMTGWELLATLRSRVEWQDLPVIMVSALVEPPPKELDSLPIFQCYVTKKKTGVELLRLVEQVLNGTYIQEPEDGCVQAPEGDAPPLS